MKNKFIGFLSPMLILAGLISCTQESGETVMDETVPGYKRWAGPFSRFSEPSRGPINPLGNPDVTITVDVVTSEYKPNIIKVKQNQIVRLVLKGGDDGDLPKITGVREFTGHGFHVLGPYDIWVTGLRSNVVKEITFKATVAGEFDLECVVFCSVDHYKMRGKFIVEPA